MRLAIALGGNALLRRGEPMTAEAQRANVRRAVKALTPIALEHEVVVTHGNGPQIGLLALQQVAGTAADPFPLDVLGAQTEGMIGYLIEQELDNALPDDRPVASLLTRVRVDRGDPAFKDPSKFVGPLYGKSEADALAARNAWTFRKDGERWRRVVPSPHPLEIREVRVIAMLMERGVTVVCAGGGGIPVVEQADGSEVGVECVIDKDHASALLARLLGAQGLIMLTDVAAVQLGFGTAQARAIRRAAPAMLKAHAFPAGSMGPKVEAACDFAEATGGFAAIGALEDAEAILDGRAGTRIERGVGNLELS
ncbi:MAG: carbamate kinase [Alphaproteobacteria bacterium]|nr:carbamate kinase [Alphaproteobacteria bacterium]